MNLGNDDGCIISYRYTVSNSYATLSRAALRFTVLPMIDAPNKGPSRLVWERPEPASRPAPAPLSRELIVRAAVRIADEEGLASVSLRKVAGALDAGPMRLYGYLSAKEDLLDLIVDEVYGEIVGMGLVEGHWREVLEAVARHTRLACRKHPWFAGLLGGRPHMGPNALTHLEMTFAALTKNPGFAEVSFSMRAIAALNAYLIGSLQSENNDLKGGLDKAQWQELWWPYLEGQIATGRFPALTRIVREADHPSPDVVFDNGLKIVLDGVDAQLPA
jgi:AcrR family transcriptional regulator